MPAYVLFIREKPIHNPAEMAEYARVSSAKPPDPKLIPLCLYGALEAVEGNAPDGVVLLQFPTVEDAKAWYYSPGYQAATQHRKLGADYRVMIVQGL